MMLLLADLALPAEAFFSRFPRNLPWFVGTTVGWVMTLVAVTSLLFLAERILFGMTAYYDAVSKGSGEATMWGLLIGFFGPIPGIIYLCVRNSPQRRACCPKCGFWHSVYEPACPRCGEPNPMTPPPINPYQQLAAERARKLLIAAIICIGVGIIIAIVGTAAFCVFVTSNAVSYGTYNW